MAKEITTIKIGKDTHAILCALGKKGESFDKIIQKIIKLYKLYKEEDKK